MGALCVIGVILVLLLVLKIYLKWSTAWCKSKVCLVGKTVIVTGANAGIGFETALEFAKRGARVILACRNENKALEAKETIIKETLNENIVIKLIDFSSLTSVKKFASDVLATEDRLDILVNNAGIAAARDKFTEDGFQTLMQINYFGPVLLTLLLIDLLQKSAPSRIINLSSVLASYANLTPENMNTYPGPYRNYNNSKLAFILFTKKLARLLDPYTTSVFSLHPGAVHTDIFHKMKWFRNSFITAVIRSYFKTPEEGAQTTLHTALQIGLEVYSGCHFVDCKNVSSYRAARNPELEDAVWNKTIEMLELEEIAKKLKKL